MKNDDTKTLLEKYYGKFSWIETNLMAELVSLCENMGLAEKGYTPIAIEDSDLEDYPLLWREEQFETIERLLNCHEKVEKLRRNIRTAIDSRS